MVSRNRFNNSFNNSLLARRASRRQQVFPEFHSQGQPAPTIDLDQHPQPSTSEQPPHEREEEEDPEELLRKIMCELSNCDKVKKK